MAIERSLGIYESAVQKRLAEWESADFVGRIWRKDATLWSTDPRTAGLSDRLGWLDLPRAMRNQVDTIRAFAQEIRSEECKHAVLLGMGGSSLAPAVFQAVFGNSRGYPELIVLDSTHPSAVAAVSRSVDPLRTLFLVSSKSGTTLETLTLLAYFWDAVSRKTDAAGRHFAAITDPGTPLSRTAEERKFRRTFLAPPDVGGRFSALSVFGLVPAALIGIDLDPLLDRAQEMAESCAQSGDLSLNPGVLLGAVLGEMGVAGRDKLLFLTDSALSPFLLWLEQLIAESTGKNGKGLIPIADGSTDVSAWSGHDIFPIGLSLGGQDPGSFQGTAKQRSAGYPVLQTQLKEMAELGGELFLWEFAVATAAAVLGIHPFEQPDVQLAKDFAKRAMQSSPGGPAVQGPIATPSRKEELLSVMEPWLRQCGAGDYIALHAYLAPNPATNSALARLRVRLQDRLRVPASVGYGPRFLHSTGQLHKGGPNSGLFLQLLDEPAEDLAVPGMGYSFGKLIRAQSEGDFLALKNRQRRVLRVNLGTEPAAALSELESML